MSGPFVRISGVSIDACNAARSRHGSEARTEHQTIKNGWGMNAFSGNREGMKGKTSAILSAMIKAEYFDFQANRPG